MGNETNIGQGPIASVNLKANSVDDFLLHAIASCITLRLLDLWGFGESTLLSVPLIQMSQFYLQLTTVNLHLGVGGGAFESKELMEKLTD